MECKESWPNNIVLDPVSHTLEKRKTIALSFVNVMGQDQDIFERFSSFKKLIRVTALVLKFVAHLKLKKSHKSHQLKNIETSDLDKATYTLILMVQAVAFSQEIKDLQINGQVNKNSKLFPLYPFLDQTGTIRVGCRISNSWLTNDKKHPVVLPPNHNFTKLLIEQEHINLFHAGTQATLSSLRSKYWIINGKNAVKQQLHKCVICFKANPRSYTPLMGDLPESRVTPARPFLKTGCEFAGPMMMKDGRLRKRSLVKAYICIFVCFVTRAVHIELAGDLTTECFLNCLKRFVSRRGLCQVIYTDNGKNFVGAEHCSYHTNDTDEKKVNSFDAIGQKGMRINLSYKLQRFFLLTSTNDTSSLERSTTFRGGSLSPAALPRRFTVNVKMVHNRIHNDKYNPQNVVK
nr:unnamed protein product [Callosobruchus analis]